MPRSRGSQGGGFGAAILKENASRVLFNGWSNRRGSRPYDAARDLFGDRVSSYKVESAAPLDALEHRERVLAQVNAVCRVLFPARLKALLIGINYFGQRGQLRSCINDVRNMVAFLVDHLGYKREDMVILNDDKHHPMSQPTKTNLLRAMHWLVKDARPNDSLFFYYSGHGVLAEDLKESNKDEGEKGGFYCTIFPVDFRHVGHITDEEMHRIMVKPLQAGVRLTAIFDSVHSGSALDLPYVSSTLGVLKEPKVAEEASRGLLCVVSSYSQGDTANYLLSQMGSNDEDAHSRAPAIITPGQNTLDNPGSSSGIPSQDFVLFDQPQPPKRQRPQDRALTTGTALAGASGFYDSKDSSLSFVPPLFASLRIYRSLFRPQDILLKSFKCFIIVVGV
ncbi:hypothetical protein RRF57_003084 [Xylaria bambusicola]|uniref:Peptidase C14 caspase domain-containing protein n=1 Tax=Xylaria bambusicola TaxID=326684 RepID=A0AAN7UE56_9PEZI